MKVQLIKDRLNEKRDVANIKIFIYLKVTNRDQRVNKETNAITAKVVYVKKGNNVLRVKRFDKALTGQKDNEQEILNIVENDKEL